MSVYFKPLFWLAAVERAIKTAAQTAAALLVGDGTGWLNIELDWGQIAGAAGLAALASLLTSIGSAQTSLGGRGDPSLVPAPDPDA